MSMEIGGQGTSEFGKAVGGMAALPSDVLTGPETQAEITAPSLDTPTSETRPVAYATDRPVQPTTDAPQEVFEPTEAAEPVWQTIPFRELDWQQGLRPFTVISGITTMHDFNAVERTVVGVVSSQTPDHGLDGAFSREAQIGRDLISNHLRPKGYVGTINNGQVLIVPFDEETMLGQNKYHRGGRPKPPTEEALQHSYGVVYTGLLRSAKGDTGQLLLQASYFPRAPRAAFIKNEDDYDVNHDGYVHRTIGSHDVIKGLAEAIKEQRRDSAAIARVVTSNALQHPIVNAVGTAKRK